MQVRKQSQMKKLKNNGKEPEKQRNSIFNASSPRNAKTKIRQQVDSCEEENSETISTSSQKPFPKRLMRKTSDEGKGQA